jgi:hypothetical protein
MTGAASAAVAAAVARAVPAGAPVIGVDLATTSDITVIRVPCVGDIFDRADALPWRNPLYRNHERDPVGDYFTVTKDFFDGYMKQMQVHDRNKLRQIQHFETYQKISDLNLTCDMQPEESEGFTVTKKPVTNDHAEVEIFLTHHDWIKSDDEYAAALRQIIADQQPGDDVVLRWTQPPTET